MWAMWGWLVWLGKRRLTWECAYVGGGKPSGASADPSLGVLHTRVACLSDDWPRGCRDSAWTLGTGLMGPLSGEKSKSWLVVWGAPQLIIQGYSKWGGPKGNSFKKMKFAP